MGMFEIDRRLNMIMKSISTNLEMEKSAAENALIRAESVEEMQFEFSKSLEIDSNSSKNNNTTKLPVSVSETKVQLTFSVDRLLNTGDETRQTESVRSVNESLVKCFGNRSIKECSSCGDPNCSGLVESENSTLEFKKYSVSGDGNNLYEKFHSQTPILGSTYLDFKSIVRPTPIRAINNRHETVPLNPPYSPMASTALLRFQQQQKSPTTQSQILSALPGPLPTMGGSFGCTAVNFGFKSFHNTCLSTQNFVGAPMLSARFPALKTHTHHLLDISMTTTNLINHHRQHHPHIVQNSNASPNTIGNNAPVQLQLTTSGAGTCMNINNNNNNNSNGGGSNGNGKRKRSWSRAVFSNLQRKGLEIQFQQQKYITKPDRRKLAARLNLTDAQVKVWFQNRRMKWRHTRENLKSGQEKQISSGANSSAAVTTSTTSNSKEDSNAQTPMDEKQALDGFSSDDSSCDDLSENEDEIDVVL